MFSMRLQIVDGDRNLRDKLKLVDTGFSFCSKNEEGEAREKIQQTCHTRRAGPMIKDEDPRCDEIFTKG